MPAADVMPSFHGSYTLDKDGGVSVTETISYRFDPAQGVRHGIYRNITVRQGLDDRPDAYRYYAMSDVSVSSPTGANSEYQLVDNGSSTTIKIGSAKVDVSGTQTYVLNYHLANVMNPFTDTQTAEFYYNVFTSDSIAKDEVDLQVTGPSRGDRGALRPRYGGQPTATRPRPARPRSSRCPRWPAWRTSPSRRGTRWPRSTRSPPTSAPAGRRSARPRLGPPPTPPWPGPCSCRCSPASAWGRSWPRAGATSGMPA